MKRKQKTPDSSKKITKKIDDILKQVVVIDKKIKDIESSKETKK